VLYLTSEVAYNRYEDYARKHKATNADPLRTYSGWLHQFQVELVDDDFEPYVFKEKPAAKSSTGVLTSTPGTIACPKCGCLMIPGSKGAELGVKLKKNCPCKCHL
jgi:hypothetical protein